MALMFRVVAIVAAAFVVCMSTPDVSVRIAAVSTGLLGVCAMLIIEAIHAIPRVISTIRILWRGIHLHY